MARPKLTPASGTTAPTPAEASFYIPAIDAPSRPRRNLKHNNTFAVFDSHGDIGASAGGEDGLFDCDTRYLSHLELLLNGSRLLLLHSAIDDDNLNYYVDLTNPDIYADGKIVLTKDTIHISRTIYLCDGSLRERIGLMNHGADPVSFTLSLAFASDFADIFEVRGIKRDKRGHVWVEVLPSSGVRLSYRGLDEGVRETTLQFEPVPSLIGESVASYVVTLAPQERRAVFVTAASRGRLPQSAVSFFRGLVGLKRELKSVTGGVTTVETSNSVVNEILCRSMADLYMLMTNTQDGLYPYAGIPWYSTTFGRDGIITAMQMLWIDPTIAAGVLRRLARLQADTFDQRADAAPGKILHEMRGGEMAALREVPFAQYYGTVDATPSVRHAGWPVRPAHQRLGAHPRGVAGDREGLGMDGRSSRLGWRRVHRVRAWRADRFGQSGVEGFARLDLSRRRPSGRGTDRPGGSAGLRICGASGRFGLRASAGSE